jgi:hypothetical protein
MLKSIETVPSNDFYWQPNFDRLIAELDRREASRPSDNSVQLFGAHLLEASSSSFHFVPLMCALRLLQRRADGFAFVGTCVRRLLSADPSLRYQCSLFFLSHLAFCKAPLSFPHVLSELLLHYRRATKAL